MSVLKTKCIESNFLIFNSFEKILKIPKTMHIHQKYIFLDLLLFFFVNFIFQKKYKRGHVMTYIITY
jgi:hypothetical protein